MVADELQQVVFVDLSQRQQDLDVRVLQTNLPSRSLHGVLKGLVASLPVRHLEVEVRVGRFSRRFAFGLTSFDRGGG